ncbi:MAG: FHA domain-containing protein [Planctomycetota bacterium]|jgi:pSer/pThr/pTyr-binding forkhead associated (FHA) protein
MIKITLKFSGNLVDTYRFDKEMITIGRDPTCDVVLDNLGVSRQHAQIANHGGIFILQDLQSNNGTFIHGKRVKSHNLNNGDEFSIGKFNLEVDLGSIQKPMVKTEPKQASVNPELTLAVDAKEMEMMQRERASKLKAYISYVAPSGKKMNQPIVKTTTFFGKAMSCDFSCHGIFIYPKHALIVRDNNGFRLVNLAPHRVTRLNGKLVDDERMQNGDKFRIGRTIFEFFVGVPPSDKVKPL